MIVRNEVAVLGRCLDSVAGLVDEAVVVDTGSTDGTIEAALARGARVVRSTWEGDFSRARNLSLAQARGRWILVLDADEYLEPGQRDALAALVAGEDARGGPPARAFTLVQKSTSDGGRSGLLVSIIRLFPNRPGIRFAWPVHEQVATSLQREGVPVADAGVTLLHTGYADPARNRLKQERNGVLLAGQIASGREVSPLTHFLYAGCALDLGDPEAALARYAQALALALALGDGEMAAASRVRMAGCLARLGRPAELLGAAAADDRAAGHPEMLNLRAGAEELLGRPDRARELREAVLACADTPRVPACTMAVEKALALRGLGELWFREGRKARGAALLRAALAVRAGGGDFGPADLARCLELNP